MKSKSQSVVNDELVDLVLGEFIAHLRYQKRLTPRSLAKRSKVHYWRIDEIENGNGKGITMKEIMKLAPVLEVEVELLYKLAIGGVYVGEPGQVPN